MAITGDAIGWGRVNEPGVMAASKAVDHARNTPVRGESFSQLL
jgi:hypothetical protein